MMLGFWTELFMCVSMCGAVWKRSSVRETEECSWWRLRTVAVIMMRMYIFVHLFCCSTGAQGDGRIQHCGISCRRCSIWVKTVWSAELCGIDNCCSDFFPYLVKYISGSEAESQICTYIYPYKAIFVMWLGIRVDPIYVNFICTKSLKHGVYKPR